MRRMLAAALAVAHIPHIARVDIGEKELRAREVHWFPVVFAGYSVVPRMVYILQLQMVEILRPKQNETYRASTATSLEHSIRHLCFSEDTL